jgi:succinoglycan biosynthesis transport protein ExoP
MAVPQNYVSVSRRPPDIEDYIDMLRRYRSWIIGPMFAGLVISVIVAFLWPDTYVSNAIMQITPQLVSSRLVPNDVSQQMSDRLTQMEQDILSRSSLSEMITRMNLYPNERRQKPLEDIIAEMSRRAISIKLWDAGSGAGPLDRRTAAAFQISFRYTDRFKARDVVQDLVRKFTEQNLQVQQRAANATTQFLDDEYKAAKDRLDELQQKITKFKLENQGRLPDQTMSNIQAEASLQTEANRIADAISQNQAQKVIMEQQLQNQINDQQYWSSRAEDTVTAGQAAVQNQQLINTEASLTSARQQLAALLKIYGENYPDVMTLKAQTEMLQHRKEDLEKQQAEASANAPKSGPVKITNPQVQARLEELKNSIASAKTTISTIQVRTERLLAQQAEINKKIAAYQARIEQAPLNAQQYEALMTDYTLAQNHYQEMVTRRNTSETVQDLEEHKGGETLGVLDPASLPEQPVEPNRLAWAAIGTALGLFIGVMLAAAKEMKDASLKNLKDVRAYTNLPVLSSIPLLENALLVRRNRRIFWLAWSSAFIVGTIAMTTSMYIHYFGGRG